MSAPRHRRVSHLLTADDALIPGRWGAHITVCGTEIRGPSAPAVEYDCCPSCDCDVVRYCPECVREAARWSAEVDDPRIWSRRPPAHAMTSVTQAACQPPVPSAAPLAVVPEPSAQTAQDEDSQPQGYYVGRCGHQVPGGPAFYVGPCRDCNDKHLLL